MDDSNDTLQSEDNNEGNNEVLQGHENRLEGDEIGGDDQDMHGDEDTGNYSAGALDGYEGVYSDYY